ncbi:MAG: rRNA maturation RNase YbeY [Patescibacteria group bacterium]|jgi:probable rRNA maturation factor
MEFRVVNLSGQRLLQPRCNGVRVTWKALFHKTQGIQGAWSGISVALVVCTGQKMARLNKQYRGKPTATDVLAFPDSTVDSAGNVRKGSGDICICPTALRRRNPKANLAELLAHRFVHSLLHLHGFLHESDAAAARMEARTQLILHAYGRHH